MGKETRKIEYLQLDSEKDAEEFALINKAASLLGLKRATFVKLHIRQTLPAKIEELKKQKIIPSVSVAG